MPQFGTENTQRLPTPSGEEGATKLEGVNPKVNRPTALPTPPEDRSPSVDSGIALQEQKIKTDDEDELLQEVCARCYCSADDVEDLYGCTPLQEAMMAQTMKEPNAYTVEYDDYLSPEIDPHRLQNAWDETARAHPALRTRMVTTLLRGCLQVVLRGPVAWQMQCDDEAVPEKTTRTVWKIGAPLVYFTFNTTQHKLQIKIHHSICDGWSMGVLLRQTEAAFRGDELIYQPFRPFVEYVEGTKPKANAFWEAKFQGADASSMSIFPRVPKTDYSPTPSHRLERLWDIDTGFNGPGTVNSKFRLAWAIVQSVYTGSNYVLFGAVSTGRGVPVKGIQDIAGPTIASVPVRITLDHDSNVGDAVTAIQKGWGACMPFEHIGLQNMLHLSPGTRAACQFQTIISVEPQDDHEGETIFSQGKSVQTAHGLFALIIRCRPSSHRIWVEMSFDPGVIDRGQVERMLSQLAHVYRQVDRSPTCLLSQLDCVSPEDITELSRMASTGLSSETPRCVYELFQRRVAEQPQGPAITSWDGDLSFQALDNISTALAVLLKPHIQRGEFVPLCIEKSKWVAIAMLAVMKAGGAFVLLDTMHPIPRLYQMCQTTQGNLIISSRSHSNITAHLDIPNNIIVDDLPLETKLTSASSLPHAAPDDPVYATFTSGSTGAPKCVVVHHSGYASSALAHGGPYRLHQDPEFFNSRLKRLTPALLST